MCVYPFGSPADLGTQRTSFAEDEGIQRPRDRITSPWLFFEVRGLNAVWVGVRYRKVVVTLAVYSSRIPSWSFFVFREAQDVFRALVRPNFSISFDGGLVDTSPSVRLFFSSHFVPSIDQVHDPQSGVSQKVRPGPSESHPPPSSGFCSLSLPPLPLVIKSRCQVPINRGP